MKLTKSRLKELIKEVYDTEGASPEETEEEIQASLEEAYAKLHNALDVASRLNPGLALEIGPIAHSVGELLNEEPEDDYEENLRRRYDKEEAAARREGPSTPRSYEEIASLYDDDEDW